MAERKSEDEWFARRERELIENLRRERLRKEKELAELMQQEEARKRKELHWMKCPKCGSDMKEQDIIGISVDRCTLCEGIYLDRGELEDLMLKKQEERRSFMRRITGLFSS
ncbi:MAG TPA: zf-TFIIB domain-containing protein [Acidobacteriota bacterium]